MQEIIRRCDMPVKKGRDTVPHGEQVDGDPLVFSVGGTAYEVDLCEVHREEFMTNITPFVSVATATSRGSTAQAVRKALKGKKGSAGFTTKDVRKWLADQGREVAPSGRLPNELIEEYRTAHSS